MAVLDADSEKFYLSISLRHFDSRFVNRDIDHELDYDHETPCSNRVLQSRSGQVARGYRGAHYHRLIHRIHTGRLL